LCANEDALTTLPSASFSLILAIEVLPYFADLDKVIHNLINCLLPGGTLIAHIPLREALWPYEQNLFNEQFLRKVFITAGFDSPEIRRTFGPSSEAICRFLSSLAERPLLLAMLYPFLLCVANLSPRFASQGTSCLLIAQRPLQEGPPSDYEKGRGVDALGKILM
jgi:SAM-dependent methyltransferase